MLPSSSKLKLCKSINNKTQLIWPPTALRACLKWNITLIIQGKSFLCCSKTKWTKWCRITREPLSTCSSWAEIEKAKHLQKAHNRSLSLIVIHRRIIKHIVLITILNRANNSRESICVKGRLPTHLERIELRHESKHKEDRCLVVETKWTVLKSFTVKWVLLTTKFKAALRVSQSHKRSKSHFKARS